MKKTKEECLLMNGIMNIDLGNNAAKIMQAMEDYANDAIEQVKTCNKPAVSKCVDVEREALLLAFTEWQKKYKDSSYVDLFDYKQFLSKQ